jgi:hypothetical protein
VRDPTLIAARTRVARDPEGSTERILAFPPRLAASVLCALCAAIVTVTGLRTAKAEHGKHLGAAACASSICHGALAPRRDSGVALDEYGIWLSRDRHSKAYQSLLGDSARRISQALAIGPAETEPACLECHTDNVPPAQRADTFQLSDGVSCEVCHGGAEKWIATHTHTSERQENIERGMYPTDEPVARATLCLPCHLGNERKFVSHAMMAAGHPRLAFELDTFTQIQPVHYRVDDDYRARKQTPSPARTWAVGQAVAAQAYLALLSGARLDLHTSWPEFVLFDCYSCHRAIDRSSVRPRPVEPTRPGLPWLNRSSLLMYREVLTSAAPKQVREFDRELRLLEQARLGSPEGHAVTVRLLEQVSASLPRVSAWSPDAEALRTMLRGVASEPFRYRSYLDAEQVAMASQALLAALREEGAPGPLAAAQSATDALFAGMSKEGEFDLDSFYRSLARLRSAVP